MQIETSGTNLRFIGQLDEQVCCDDLCALVRDLRTKHPGQVLQLDLSQVERANSCGILTWARVVAELNQMASSDEEPVAVYVKTPKWLIEQVSMMGDQLVSAHVYVQSFLAPYCEVDGHRYENLLLEVGKDIPVQPEYDDEDLQINYQGHTWEPDFDPDVYLAFITEYVDLYRKSIAECASS